ncbi:MAG: DegV family protein [Dehalococcoidia bacterium]
MIRDIAVVTDSASYLPSALSARYGVRVVPLTVTIDGCSYREGLDIDAETLYARLASGASATTSQPSPGELLDAYRACAEGGARAVVSAHIGAAVSGTVQSARLAAAAAPVPVTVVDTGQASFAEGLVVWELLKALERGEDPGRMQAYADGASSRVGNTFIVKGLDLLRRGGRLEAGAAAVAIPVLAMREGAVRVVGSAANVPEAVEHMASHVREAAENARGPLRVGIGHGAAAEIAGALRAEVARIPGVGEVIDYVVGPSIGAHAGPGNAGAVFIDRIQS